MNNHIASTVVGSNKVGRPYFTFMDRVREAVRVPVKHLESYFEPQGHDYESQLPNTENLYGNTAMVFNAYLTHNAIDMNTWHDMDKTYHNQFGTVDNPVVVFTTDSSWRIVICQGPGVEDESHSHEKMFYFVREGPMNRCHLCGQCFKLVRLKDEYSEVNDYYSFMFSSLSHFDVSEEDSNIPVSLWFGDRPSPSFQQSSATNVYVHVNPDEADHMLVDPAYKLEKLEHAYERLEAMFRAYRRVEKESQLAFVTPTQTSMTIYDNWYEIERSIRRLDRLFLKVEKFHARQFIDSGNHDRREQRMLNRKRDRWTDNYTYFFGGLSEEELMYRDYYKTDLEQYPEDEKADQFLDQIDIASQGEFQFDKYDFIETSLYSESQESLVDIIDKKIFKFKYRMLNDNLDTYFRRMDRVMARQLERAKHRDPVIEANLHDMLEKNERETAFGRVIYGISTNEMQSHEFLEETEPLREYMYEEGMQAFKDYFESDEEEYSFFEYCNELPGRDRIKFIDIYEDHTVMKKDGKGHVRIPKREYNPELSFFANASLDLIDFKERVVPLANDAARLDSTIKHQRMSAQETVDAATENRKKFDEYFKAQGLPTISWDKKSDGLLSSEELLSSDEFTQKTHPETMHAQEHEEVEEGHGEHEEEHEEDLKNSSSSSDGSTSSSESSSDQEHQDRKKD
jgi:hypothetical protein